MIESIQMKGEHRLRRELKTQQAQSLKLGTQIEMRCAVRTPIGWA